MVGTWIRLAHVALSGAGDTIDSGTFTAKKNMKVIIHTIASGTILPTLKFNNDSGSNYANRYNSDESSETTQTSQTSIQIDAISGSFNQFHTMYITNVETKEKLLINEMIGANTAGAGNAPRRSENVAKWANTSSQITSIQVVNAGSGDFDTGSYITVLGAKEAATANVITVSDLAAKKHLMIQAKIKGGNGNTFTFNNDTGNNYTHRYSNNGGSDGTQTSRANLWSYYDGSDTTKFTTLYVLNEASKEKLVITHNVSAVGTGAGTAPTRTETVGKWTNTSNQITRVDVGTFTTDGIEEGSEVTVYGTD